MSQSIDLCLSNNNEGFIVMVYFMRVCSFIFIYSHAGPTIDNLGSSQDYLYLPDPLDGSLYVSGTHGLKVHTLSRSLAH